MPEQVEPSEQIIPWDKGALISSWVTQSTFAICLLIAFVNLGTTPGTIEHWPETHSLLIWIMLSIVPLAVISLNVAEVVLFIQGDLRSRTYLITQYIKCGLWVALSIGICSFVTILMILLARPEDWGDPIYWCMVIMCALASLCFVAPLIYAYNVHYRLSHDPSPASDINETSPLLSEENPTPPEREI